MYAYDARNGSERTHTNLEKGYTEHRLVSLAPDANNYVYVWSSNHGPVSPDNSYIAKSSDIYVYTRDNLTKVAHFSHVRTGFDVTIQHSDDEAIENGKVHKAELGRGLVFIRKNDDGKATVALVAYDDATSQAAHIVEFDEADFNTSSVTTNDRTIVTSKQLEGWNIDIESPIPDNNDGIFFQCYSGDLDAYVDSHNKATEAGTTRVYHLPYDDDDYGTLIELNERGFHTNSELVVKEGTHKNKILMYKVFAGSDTVHYTNNKISVYLWTGKTPSDYVELKDQSDLPLGSELEKPFSDGEDGLFFMIERKIASGDEADTLCHWDGKNSATYLWTSGAELEIEEPPIDDNHGFYFVNVSNDIDNSDNSGTTHFTLRHCYKNSSGTWTTRQVEDLGTFDVPQSIFIPNPDDSTEMPAERLQSEHGFYLDEHDKNDDDDDDDNDSVLFVGAGPVDGDFKLTIMDWSDNTALKTLVTYTAADMGGYSEIAGMVKFTESSPHHSSSGCNAGFGGLLGLMIILPLIQVCRSKFRK